MTIDMSGKITPPTVAPRSCKCEWCLGVPRHPADMLCTHDVVRVSKGAGRKLVMNPLLVSLLRSR